MVENSAIEWTHHTFNPWIGCQKVSPGCDHCFAETLDARFGGGHWGPHAERRRTGAKNWNDPVRWNKRAGAAGVRERVFCASMADVFDNAVPSTWRDDLWHLIDQTPHLDWLLLTKRPQNIAKMLPPGWGDGWPNVWLGTTVENQAEADRRVPLLLGVPALVRFLSCEPLLGLVDLTPWLGPDKFCESCDDGEGYGNRCGGEHIPRDEQCPWMRAVVIMTEHGPCDASGAPKNITADVRVLNWVIAGGESGPGARPMHPDWARSLRDQCAAAGIPFLFKQWGDWEPALDRERDDPDWRKNYSSEYVDHGKSKWLNLAGGCGFHGGRFHVMRNVGKKVSGRLLDGVEHNGYPEHASVAA